MKEYLFKGKTEKGSEIVTGCYVFGYENGKEIHTIVNQTIKQKQTGEFSSYIVKPNSVKYINENERQDFMLQQLLGYKLGKKGVCITELIISAGLSKKEWFNINPDEIDITSLDNSDIKKIEEFVNKLE